MTKLPCICKALKFRQIYESVSPTGRRKNQRAKQKTPATLILSFYFLHGLAAANEFAAAHFCHGNLVTADITNVFIAYFHLAPPEIKGALIAPYHVHALHITNLNRAIKTSPKIKVPKATFALLVSFCLWSSGIKSEAAM